MPDGEGLQVQLRVLSFASPEQRFEQHAYVSSATYAQLAGAEHLELAKGSDCVLPLRSARPLALAAAPGSDRDRAPAAW